MTKTLYVPDHIMEKYNNPNEGVKADRTELQKLPKPVVGEYWCYLLKQNNKLKVEFY